MSDGILSGGVLDDPPIGGDVSDPALSAGTVGSQGPAGPPGPKGDVGPVGPARQALTFQILGASSFSAAHGLAYVPAVRITDPGGAEVETDLIHSPGQVTAVFPGPFTGLLTIG